jgi:GH25 family lysozyme M1 (1,4-beta-N-acetylmuramidase)
MTIFGWDMSHFDSPGIGTAVSEGISFITHKAGGDANDQELGTWWQAAKAVRGRLLLGAYWVLYPGNPVARADAFLARLDALCSGWRDGPFLLQVDCEQWNNNAATVPPLADIRAFCDRLVGRMPKLRPVVYAPQWVYRDRLRGLGYPLWASSYVTGSGSFRTLYPGDSSTRWVAYSGQVPAILQYTSSATIGGQTTCDANAFRGTLAELVALVAPGWEEKDMQLSDKTGNQAYQGRTVEDFFSDFWKLRDVLWGDATGTKVANLPPTSPLAKMIALPAQVPTADATAQAFLAALTGHSVADIAAALKVVLGDQAAAVGAALQAAGE